jgi:thioester reductase-like protein/SAM-dependent methyltransferase/acyl carrier protein
MADLSAVGEDLILREPVIHHERATKEGAITAMPLPGFVASHMRDPVYFDHAVQRLAHRYPSAIWLEAGFNSGITTMASRALGSPESSYFQPINLTSTDALADATANLWKEGLNISFWAHHVVQTSEYTPLLLPPYQFEKPRHWLERKKPPQKDASPAPPLLEAPGVLWTFLGFQDAMKTHAQFHINTTSTEFQTHVSAHIIALAAPICPTGFQHFIATDALASLVAEEEDSQLQPELQRMENHAPIRVDASRRISLNAERTPDDPLAWDWNITSTSMDGAASASTLHVTGRVIFRNAKDAVRLKEFAKYERLVDQQRYLALLDGNEADQVIQGSRNIYKSFEPVVKYNEDEYKGLQKIAAKGNESAGRVLKRDEKTKALGVGLADMFCQVAGIFLNCMADCEDGEMYLSNKVDQWIRSPKVSPDSPGPWEVYARHYQPSDKEYVSDVFVFDPADGQLMWAIIGLGFIKVSIAGMARMLTSLSPGSKAAEAVPAPRPAPAGSPIPNGVFSTLPLKTVEPASRPKPVQQKKVNNIDAQVRELLCNLLGLDEGDIKPTSDLVDLGIDSLLAMDVQRVCKIELELDELVGLTDFQSLVSCVQAKSGIANGEEDEGSDDSVAIKTLADSGDVSVDGSLPQVNGNGSLPHVNRNSTSASIPAAAILDTFAESKLLTDHFIEENNLSGYTYHVLPTQNELVVVHIVDAFEQMGCSLRTAEAGQVLDRILCLPRHEQVVAVFYNLLEKARLVDLDGSKIIRTAVPVTPKSATTLLQELLRESPEHGHDHNLTSLTGCRLADCLMGRAEGVQLLFGTPESRELVSRSYAGSPIHSALIGQLAYFWNLLLAMPTQEEPINILELGAGTGGTTSALLPILAASGIPIRYTVTDVSPGLVAGLRKRFNKQYPFMRFEVLDMEKSPSTELLHSQHAVLATNCVHATRSLAVTTKNIHELLRPDGFLVMLEMTDVLPWVDLVFGLTEGWWLFTDGRSHACVRPTAWKTTLQSNGYGHVDWTEGDLPESSIQQLIIALASGERYERVAIPIPPKPLSSHTADFAARQAVVNSFVDEYTRQFSAPVSSPICEQVLKPARCALVTGATGSLGSHVVAYFASQPTIRRVICLNRISNSDHLARQLLALDSRDLILDTEALSKLQVLETDSSKPMLGLSTADYTDLTTSVTDIVHNAWPMSLTRPVRGFEPQFKTMRNLIDLARECRRPGGPKIVFQFISSIATVGYHPFVSGQSLAPEEKVTVDSALPIGYADAKLICEHMIKETLHQYPDDFRAMTVRLGQIAGSKTTGYWNPVEHLAHLIKSSQTLRVLPDLHGVRSVSMPFIFTGCHTDILTGTIMVSRQRHGHYARRVAPPRQNGIPKLPHRKPCTTALA